MLRIYETIPLQCWRARPRHKFPKNSGLHFPGHWQHGRRQFSKRPFQTKAKLMLSWVVGKNMMFYLMGLQLKLEWLEGASKTGGGGNNMF